MQQAILKFATTVLSETVDEIVQLLM